MPSHPAAQTLSPESPAIRAPSHPPDWLLPDWPAPSHVRATVTSRHGGVSGGVYSSLNLGDHVGDGADAVARNRLALEQALGVRPVFLEQVHGTQVQRLHRGTPDGLPADACLTAEPGLACTIMVADCLPVLFTDTDGRFVAAAHAGWRGLAGDDRGGVLESVHREISLLLEQRSPAPAPELMAWLGPCIGPSQFEVGTPVRQEFLKQDPQAHTCFLARGDKWLANLPALARRRLARLGVQRVYGNDGSAAWCTVSQPSRFFSHRRDRVSGRMAASIWLLAAR